MEAGLPQALEATVARVVPTLPAGERGVWEVGEALRVLPAIEAAAGSRNAFRQREHEIQLGLTGNLQATVDTLASIRDLELAAAPEVVALRPLGAGASALLLRYCACVDEQLRPIDPARWPLREDARRRFREEMGRLVGRGLLHAGVRTLHDALVSSETGTIVLTRWSSLASCTPAEGADWLATVDLLLRT